MIPQLSRIIKPARGPGKPETCNASRAARCRESTGDIINPRKAGVISQKLPSFWSILWVSLFLGVIGWGGLVLLVFLTLPTLAPRWLFFFLLMLALSGSALPVVYFLNRRFPSDPPVDSAVVLREAMWVGIFGSLLAWLQMGRVLTTALMVVLAVGLILVEFLLRTSERSQWAPQRGEPHPPAVEDEEWPEEDEEDDE
jgi:hypothetical protein